jgi:UDP-2,3-diacylglucosamine pyrophosphatase LpxH
MHVAHYAKRFPRLYDILCRHVRLNAVEFAREHGYAAITCGHTHFAEDVMVDGIRYINTGAWTEAPVVCLWMDDVDMKLIRVEAT